MIMNRHTTQRYDDCKFGSADITIINYGSFQAYLTFGEVSTGPSGAKHLFRS